MSMRRMYLACGSNPSKVTLNVGNIRLQCAKDGRHIKHGRVSFWLDDYYKEYRSSCGLAIEEPHRAYRWSNIGNYKHRMQWQYMWGTSAGNVQYMTAKNRLIEWLSTLEKKMALYIVMVWQLEDHAEELILTTLRTHARVPIPIV